MGVRLVKSFKPPGDLGPVFLKEAASRGWEVQSGETAEWFVTNPARGSMVTVYGGELQTFYRQNSKKLPDIKKSIAAFCDQLHL